MSEAPASAPVRGRGRGVRGARGLRGARGAIGVRGARGAARGAPLAPGANPPRGRGRGVVVPKVPLKSPNAPPDHAPPPVIATSSPRRLPPPNPPSPRSPMVTQSDRLKRQVQGGASPVLPPRNQASPGLPPRNPQSGISARNANQASPGLPPRNQPSPILPLRNQASPPAVVTPAPISMPAPQEEIDVPLSFFQAKSKRQESDMGSVGKLMSEEDRLPASLGRMSRSWSARKGAVRPPSSVILQEAKVDARAMVREERIWGLERGSYFGVLGKGKQKDIVLDHCIFLNLSADQRELLYGRVELSDEEGTVPKKFKPILVSDVVAVKAGIWTSSLGSIAPGVGNDVHSKGTLSSKAMQGLGMSERGMKGVSSAGSSGKSQVWDEMVITLQWKEESTVAPATAHSRRKTVAVQELGGSGRTKELVLLCGSAEHVQFWVDGISSVCFDTLVSNDANEQVDVILKIEQEVRKIQYEMMSYQPPIPADLDSWDPPA